MPHIVEQEKSSRNHARKPLPREGDFCRGNAAHCTRNVLWLPGMMADAEAILR
jgi:hypothetical protein